VERVIQPPLRGMHYLAHLGVAPGLRGQGIGRALVAHLLEQGRAQGKRRMALDVATDNSLAQALYERLGFAIVGERHSTLANAQGAVPAHRRMERVLPE
ncbi:MAG TPA: GNAT family N-acetyltransferase, partial [Pseudoxanthomonas sp.]|nr:GNAT family N-acetyltransferase [Pseudoxanthomonas sp.]